MTRVSHGIDRIDATFDDPNLVANAGLLLVATLSARLGMDAVINSTVRLVGRVGGARPGRKVLTLVHAMVAGAAHIDHADILRAGATGGVLSHRVTAPSTLGTFLRSFTFGHVRQLEAATAEILTPGLAVRRRSRRSAVGDRCRLDDLRSRRPRQAGRRLRVHPPPRVHPILATRPTPAKSSMPGYAKVLPTPNAARNGSSRS